MIGFSKDIEAAIDTIIEGLEYEMNVEDLDATKLKSLMKSKENSFKYAKEMIHKWENSQNKPNPEKLKAYIERLVDAGDKALITLRQFLREKINYHEVPEDKHHLVTEGKSVLHQAIVNIDSNILELRLQLEADKFNLDDKEFKRGYPERFANQELFPLKNYNTEWYDIDNDSIVICPKGTRGKIIELDELRVTLPKEPEDKTTILFHDLPKEEQYWERTPMPKGLTPDTEESFKDYIVEEFRRRREGLWFYNNGEAVWLPPSFYFALQWCKMKDDGGYMDFRYAQLYMAYHAEACELDKRCLGEFFVKSRRTGYTYEKVFRLLNSATSTNNVNIGMTSKTDDDAKEAFAKLSYAFQNLPFFFQPVTKNTVDNANYLHFAKPTDKSKKAKKNKDTNTDDYLNTYMDYKATSEGSYDGYKMHKYLGEEASKWANGRSFEKHWGQVSPTFDEGGKIVGKAYIGSTVAARKKGGKEFHNLYLSSLLKKRNKVTGRTPSGLYSYFLPAHKNMTEFTDKYGVCHEVVADGDYFENVYGNIKKIGSIAYLEAKRKSKRRESEIAYNEELRAFPMNIEEAFRDEATSCIFNIEKINEQLDYIQQVEVFDLVKEGNFHWKDGVQDSEVIWQPSKNGNFRVTWIPPKEMTNRWVNKVGYGGYSRSPLNGEFGVFGCDSYDIEGTVDGVGVNGKERENAGSKGALHGVTKFSMGTVPSEHFFLEYISREKTTEKFFENVLMACVFYGMPILIENNKPRLLYHFKNRGYRNFAITRFDKPMNMLSKAEKSIGGVPNSSDDMKNRHATAIESYIEKNIGYIEEEGDYNRMFFERTLRDWLEFDIKNRTKYDATISSGLALMAKNMDDYKFNNTKSEVVTINIKR